jgi:hypothetical protein
MVQAWTGSLPAAFSGPARSADTEPMRDARAETDRPLLFLHVPKTGGGTLGYFLYHHPAFLTGEIGSGPVSRFYNYGIYHYPGGFYKEPPDFDPAYRRIVSTLPGLRAVFGHFSYGLHDLLPSGGRYITIIRDPVDRLVSLYRHLRQETLRTDVDFETFLTECPIDGWSTALRDWNPDPERPEETQVRQATRGIVDNDQVRRISGQEPPFGECTPAMLESAKRNLRRDFLLVGTTERFDEMVLLLDTLLGSSSDPRYLPRHVARSNRGPEGITSRERTAIEARNQLDLELYTYANALADEQMQAAGSRFGDRLREFQERQTLYVRENAELIAELGTG